MKKKKKPEKKKDSWTKRETPGFGQEWHHAPTEYNLGGREGSAKIDLGALLASAARDAMKALFGIVDEDGSGVIDGREMGRTARHTEENYPPSLWCMMR